MKILVLSDSHGTPEFMEQAVEAERPDLVCHLGDGRQEAEQLRQSYPQTPFLLVPGNCDFPDWREPLTKITEEGGIRILMTHGHSCGVKGGLLRLWLTAKENQCQVALFGHTHVPYCQCKDGIWLLNPGSCRSRLQYGIVRIEKETVLCYNVGNKEK